MPPGRFWFLVCAMLDVINPDMTDPIEVVATRKVREKALARIGR